MHSPPAILQVLLVTFEAKCEFQAGESKTTLDIRLQRDTFAPNL